MDCLEAMRQMEDNAFDLAVVDPPYGIGVQSMNFKKSGPRVVARNVAAKRRDYRRTDEWDIKPPQEYFDQLFRVSQKQIIWGGNYFQLPPSKGFLIWDKRGMEEMSNDFADCELAWLSPGLGVARVFRFVWNGMLQGDMKNKEERFHPTQKPVALYKWILSKYAKPGDKILDTHLGSGSSRIAAYDLGFDFVGYEIDKFYFDKQEERFEKHTAQLDLFH
jgi:site-specific DNA-methyltransferase (adenine-specific)